MVQNGPDLSKVRTRFLEAQLERHEQLEAIHHCVSGDNPDKDNIMAANQILHRIAGAGASLGFERLGNLAADIEMLGDGILESPENDTDFAPYLKALDAFLDLSHSICLKEFDQTA